MSTLNERYQEWETPCGPPGDHFLNEISNKGAFRANASKDIGDDLVNRNPNLDNPELTEVYAAVNIYDIRSINSQEEAFTCRLRLYLLLEMDCYVSEKEYLNVFRERALELGHYYTLKDAESTQLMDRITIPTVTFFNATEIQELDDAPSIRVYGGRNGAILWNCGFLITFKEYFPLQNFPFDRQNLQIDIRQDDSRSWDRFKLTVCCVQFHAKALQIPEWKMYEPSIKRGQISHKSTTISIHVERLSRYYLMNIIVVMLMLSTLSFVVFALPSTGLNDRISVHLTLLLTAVAFKLVIADLIPKVGYSTLLDKFVLGNMGFLFISTILCTIPALLGEEYDFSIFCISIVLFFLINLSWFVSVVYSKQNMKHRPLDLEEGRNWYSSFFANPFFLPEPKKYE